MLTVDKIMKGFNKVVSQLESVIAQCEARTAQNQKAIASLQQDSEQANAERDRAATVAANLYKLLN